jgi:hypothetical protein
MCEAIEIERLGDLGTQLRIDHVAEHVPDKALKSPEHAVELIDAAELSVDKCTGISVCGCEILVDTVGGILG